ncbi:hypothetical protein [Lysobacter capsici]|uniref:hypothetical protein n=1 Tax=Lysobacter capsici TaxID=435897 RepID=UPI00398D5C11
MTLARACRGSRLLLISEEREYKSPGFRQWEQDERQLPPVHRPRTEHARAPGDKQGSEEDGLERLVFQYVCKEDVQIDRSYVPRWTVYGTEMLQFSRHWLPGA